MTDRLYCARCKAFMHWRFTEAVGEYTYCTGGHLITESDRRRSAFGPPKPQPKPEPDGGRTWA